MFKGWIDKLTKKKTADATPADTSPEALKKKKKAEAEKKFKRVADAMKIANKGAEIYKNTADKVGELSDKVVETTKDLTKPVSDITKGVTNTAKGVLGGAFETTKGKLAEGAKAAGEKIEEIKQDNAKKPSTGSGLLDFLAPAVPETDATKPKVQKTDDAQKPPQP